MPCARLIERLSTEDQTSLIAAQFVPLKIDTGSEDWGTWSQKYQYEGNSIPIVMVVRADGEQLYGRSGSMAGDTLPAFLLEMLGNSGAIPTTRQLESIQSTLDGLKSARLENDWKQIGKQLRAVKKLGEPGSFGSYAAASLELDKLTNEICSEAIQRLNNLEAAIDEFTAGSNATDLIVADFTKAKEQLSHIAFVNSTIAQRLRKLARSEPIKSHLANAKRHESADPDDRVANSNSHEAKQHELRTWTSSNGKHSIEASLVSVEDGVVQLEKTDGQIIHVALSKLSKADQEWVK